MLYFDTVLVSFENKGTLGEKYLYKHLIFRQHLKLNVEIMEHRRDQLVLHIGVYL